MNPENIDQPQSPQPQPQIPPKPTLSESIEELTNNNSATPNDTGVQIKPIHIRTYGSDAAEALQQKKASVVKIAVAEQKRKDEINEVPVQKKGTASKSIAVLLFSLILLGAGGGGLYYLYTEKILGDQTIKPETSFIAQSLIDADNQKEINISIDRDVIQAVTDYRENTQAPVGSIEHIVFTEGTTTEHQVVTAQTFLTIINSHAPSSLLRSLKSEFMFGIYILSQSEPFLILKTDSFEQAFPGMLEWETRLREDINELFIPLKNSSQTIEETLIIEPNITNVTTGTSTATTSLTTVISTSTASLRPEITTDDLLTVKNIFTDLIIRNKDVRALRNTKNEILLLYTFIDKETIIITRNETTLREVLNRIEKKVYEL